MNFRDMYKTVFGNKQPPQTTTSYKMLNNYTPQFSPFTGNMYDSATVRTCIDAIARNAGKLKCKHIRRTDKGITNLRSSLETLIQVRPNPYMNGYAMLYKLVSQLFCSNNAFIYIQRDSSGDTIGLYPISYQMLELREYMGQLYCKFTFLAGRDMTVPYEDIIHLRRHYNDDDFFGESNTRPLMPVLGMIKTQDQGIVNAIKSSARLRGWLKFSQTVRPDDLEAKRKDFVKNYLSYENENGIAAVDASFDYIPTEIKSVMADDKQMAISRDSVYRYFGVNEKIVTNTYKEEEFNAFYSSVLEPIALELSLEFTSKCFTKREKDVGNEIVFSASRLTFASNLVKVNLAKQLVPYGIFTINDIREIFEYEPREDGDKYIQTLNVVDAAKVNDYQGVGDNKTGDNEGGGNGDAEETGDNQDQ